MNTLYKKFKTQLLLTVVLFGALASFAQPVVQVPSNCTVVVAGTGVGAITGLGGKVGNNGIVTMPDPSGGGKFSLTSGTNVGSWTLKGDLTTIPTVKPYGTAIQTAGAVISLNVFTYNKKVRQPSEFDLPSTPILARSKGSVTIVYNPTPSCAPSITFQVFKTYNNYDPITKSYVPSIVGLPCIKPDTQYTYSVDQIASDNIGDNIGVDNYYWTINGMTVINSYTSADNSSITFRTPGPTLPTGNLSITCCFGRANQWDGEAGGSHKTCVELPLKVVPVIPVITPTLYLLPSQANCITTGSAPVSYSIPDNPAYTYNWTSSESTWLMTQSSTGGIRTFKIDFNGSNNPGKVTLKINSLCDPVEFTFQINRTLASGLGITAVAGGVPVTCLTTATSYSLPQSALGNATTWKIDTIPAGGTLPTGAPTVTNVGTPNSTTLVTPGTASGQFSLVATSNATTTCTTNNTRITINIPLGAPSFTAGTPSCVLKNTNITTIAVLPVTGATSYTWTLPSGWSFVSGNTTVNPTFLVATTATGTFGALSVVANNGSGCNSASSSKNISYIAVTLTPNALLDAPDQYFVNSCGGYARWYLSGSTTPLANPAPPLSNYTISGTAGNTLLLGGNNIALVPSSVCANIYSDAAYTILVATVCAPLPLGSHGLRQAATSSISDTKEVIEGVGIFPNPNNGIFYIKVENVKEAATATLNDFSGNEVASYVLKKGNNKLGSEELPKGTYILIVKVDGKQETRQIIIR